MHDLVMYVSGWNAEPYQRDHHFTSLFERQGIKTCVLTRGSKYQKYPFEHNDVCSELRYIGSFPLRSRLTKGLTRAFVAWQEYKAFRQLVDNIPVIINCIPRVLPEKAKPLVFDCCDDFAAFGPKRNTEIDRLQYKLAKKADLIWTTSHKLYDYWHKQFPNKTYLIPNGADVQHFASSVGFSPEPNRPLLAGRSAIVGYCGAIASWFDFRLVIEVAERLPGLQFVLVGPVYSKSRYVWPDNVTLLGPKAYAELPLIMKQFDCCIIPFIVNDLTKATNPIKLFEYFAAGKPVVSTALFEVQQYQGVGVLETANNVEDFAAAIEISINLSWSKDMVRKRLLIAQKNSWETRFEAAYKTLVPLLSSSSRVLKQLHNIDSVKI